MFLQRGHLYELGEFHLNMVQRRLLHHGQVVSLTPKVFDLLVVLVEAEGRIVSKDELLKSLWPGTYVEEGNVTQSISVLRRALAADTSMAEYIETVPRQGYRFMAPVREVSSLSEEIITLDRTRSRLVIEEEASSESRLGAPFRFLVSGGRQRIVAPVLLIVAALGVWMSNAGGINLYWLQWRGRVFSAAPSYQAIAVLPFESLSDGVDQKYLADGMTEALITNLGQASPLRVVARTSVNQYQKTEKPVREIARELNVDVLVEGTIRQSGDRVRVTANLIQVSPEKHIWANSYERSLRDALALENEIAGAIASEIQGKLTPRQQARLANSRPVNPEAQLAYWKARYLLDHTYRGSADDYSKIAEYPEQAVRMDPGYAAAHAALAEAYWKLADAGIMLPKEAMARAKAAALRAIALDEELAYAHATLGYILLDYDWDWAGAEREAKRAITLNPSDPEARWLLSNYLAAVGRNEEAVVEAKQARELSPFSFHLNWTVARMLCLARKYDDALAELRQAGDMERNSSAVDIWIFKSYWMKGQADEAIAADLRIHRYRDGLDAESLDALRRAHSTNGSASYWAKLRELVLPKFGSYPNGWYRLAEINTYLGDKEEAFRWLGKAFEGRSVGWLPFIKVDPTLDPLRSDPRFRALLERMGLPP
jgi:TolB-like protein/DNA-binding winged helix-turn-helix (wHTH) protein